MAQTLRRAVAAHSFFISKRLLSTTTTITSPSPLPSILFSRRSVAPLSHAVQSLFPFTTTRFSQIRCNVDHAGNFDYSTLKSGFKSSERPSSKMRGQLFPGTDFEHWLIVMDNPVSENVTKQQMIDCYVKTLAQVLGSEEEAKKKIYNVSFDRYFGFGCEIDEATSNKLEGLPGVLFVVPDSYVDAENKDYGAELFVNGEIVERSPERQMRVGPRNRIRENAR